MKELLDSEEIEKVPIENIFFTYEFLFNVLKLEILLFLVVAYLRIDLIIYTIQLGELRRLVNVIDYENGWTFVLLLSLIGTNVYILMKGFRSILWPVKMGGFLSIIALTELHHWQVNWIIFILMFYYCFERIWSKFKVKKRLLTFYFLLSFGIVFLFIYIESSFGFINY